MSALEAPDLYLRSLNSLPVTVGATLYSKKGTRAAPLGLLWLFTYRFFIAPAISISSIWGIRTAFPNLIVSSLPTPCRRVCHRA